MNALTRPPAHPHSKAFIVSALLILALLAVVLVGPVGQAEASVVVRLSTDQLQQAAADIFAGQVVATEARETSPGFIETFVTVRVLQALKGAPGLPGDTITIKVPGGTVGDLTLMSDVFPVFKLGEAAMLYLDWAKRVVGGFQGKRALTVTESALYGALPYGAWLDDSAGASPGGGVASAVVVSGITPSSGSAGTGTEVTITGSGFGATQGSGSVRFFYNSGQPTIPATVRSWSNTSIVCTVPVADVGGYPASAGSGPVTVTGSDGSTATYNFNVTFGYGQLRWSGTNVSYRVNPNTGDTTAEESLVDAGAATWNAASSFKFNDAGTTSVTTVGRDGVNAVFWTTDMSILGGSSTLAATWYGWVGSTLDTCDIAFNDNYSWGSGSGSTYDVQGIATHELGHWLSLRDLYGSDSDKIMYGYGSSGTAKRTLSAGDVAGIQWIYGGGSTTQYTLTTSVVGSGSITRNPSQATYNEGSTVILTAVPATGWTFSGWSGDASGSISPTTITMNANKSVTATFVEVPQVTLTTAVVGGGSITRNPNQATYNEGSAVTLTAVPAVGYAFSGWSGDASGSISPTTITMNANKSVTATFVVAAAPVVRRYEETNALLLYTGTWFSGSSVVYSGGTYKYATSSGASVTAVFDGTGVSYIAKTSPAYGYAKLTLDGGTPVYVNLYTSSSMYKRTVWSRTGLSAGTHTLTIEWTSTPRGSAGGTTISLDALDIRGALLDATQVPQYTLTPSVVGSGSITRNPNQATYNEGSTVILTAVPAAGWTFSGWSGDASGSTSPTTVTMNANKSVTATFVEVPQYTLTTSVVGGGSITRNPSQATYNEGSTVILTAVPATGWTFSGWSGDASGSISPTTITMNANKSVTATFVEVPQVTLTTAVVGGGSITRNPNQATYNEGSAVTLTAVPAVGYAFSGWSGDASGSISPTTITMNANKSVTATFVVAAAPVVRRYEETNALLLYTGTWFSGSSVVYSGGTYKYATSSGASVTAVFDGTGVSYIAKTSPAYGYAKLTLDGGTPVYVNLYTSSSMYKRTVWSRTGLSAGTHTLTIEWTSTPRGSAGGTTISLDALDITGTLISAG